MAAELKEIRVLHVVVPAAPMVHYDIVKRFLEAFVR